MQQNSSNPRYQSIEQLEKLFSEGYVINRVSHPPTSDGSASIMVDLVQSSRHEECLLTVFGEEAVKLSKHLKSSTSAGQKGDIVE
jgi:hypothetical protein